MSRERIFVGGFGGSGTRVVQRILQRAGYAVGTVNEFFDWYGMDFVPIFDAWYFQRGRSRGLREFMETNLPEASFSVKVGLLMYCIPELREWFPGCKFVYVFRNPWDQMSNDYHLHARYGGLPVDAPLLEKVKYWCRVSEPAMKSADLCVNLEELVATPHAVVRRILCLAGVEDTPGTYVDIIERPETMGRAQDFYHLISELDEPQQQWLLGLYGVTNG